ncbi:MAG: hypothetical protein HWE16_01235 [Gammaproteobacteria bacterium]|nr:hypothetical protein [Gammaproteobacteria bacterium]
MWKNQQLKALAALKVEVLDFDETSSIYHAKVTMTLTPEVQSANFFKINELLMKSPQNIFIVSKYLNGNPLDITQIQLPKETNDIKNKVIAEYFSIIADIENDYENWAK